MACGSEPRALVLLHGLKTELILTIFCVILVQIAPFIVLVLRYALANFSE